MNRRVLLKGAGALSLIVSKTVFGQNRDCVEGAVEQISPQFKIDPKNYGNVSYKNHAGEQISVLEYETLCSAGDRFIYDEKTHLEIVIPDLGEGAFGILSRVRESPGKSQPSLFGNQNIFQFYDFAFLKWNSAANEFKLTGVLRQNTQFYHSSGSLFQNNLQNFHCIGILSDEKKEYEIILALASLTEHKIQFLGWDFKNQVWALLSDNLCLNSLGDSPLLNSYAFYSRGHFEGQNDILQVYEPHFGMAFYSLHRNSSGQFCLVQSAILKYGAFLTPTWQFQQEDCFLGDYRNGEGKSLLLFLTSQKELKALHLREEGQYQLSCEVAYEYCCSDSEVTQILRLDSRTSQQQILVGLEKESGFFVLHDIIKDENSPGFEKIYLQDLNNHHCVQEVLSQHNAEASFPKDFVLLAEKIGSYEKSPYKKDWRDDGLGYRLDFATANFNPGEPDVREILFSVQLDARGNHRIFDSGTTSIVEENQNLETLLRSDSSFTEMIERSVSPLLRYSAMGFSYFFPQDFINSTSSFFVEDDADVEEHSSISVLGMNFRPLRRMVAVRENQGVSNFYRLRTFLLPEYIHERDTYGLLYQIYDFFNAVSEIYYSIRLARHPVFLDWERNAKRWGEEGLVLRAFLDFIDSAEGLKFISSLHQQLTILRSMFVLHANDFTHMNADIISTTYGFIYARNTYMNVMYHLSYRVSRPHPEVFYCSFKVRRFWTYFVANYFASPRISFESKVNYIRKRWDLSEETSLFYREVLEMLVRTWNPAMMYLIDDCIKRAPLVMLKEKLQNWREGVIGEFDPSLSKVRCVDFASRRIPSEVRFVNYLIWKSFFNNIRYWKLYKNRISLQSLKVFEINGYELDHFYSKNEVLLVPEYFLEQGGVYHKGDIVMPDTVKDLSKNPLLVGDESSFELELQVSLSLEAAFGLKV